jgi:hypothetical protein
VPQLIRQLRVSLAHERYVNHYATPEEPSRKCVRPPLSKSFGARLRERAQAGKSRASNGLFTGAEGNAGIAAYRDSFFRPLRLKRPKDTIVLTNSYETFRYIVDAVEIVGPTDVQVLHRTSNPELTLVAWLSVLLRGIRPEEICSPRAAASSVSRACLRTDRCQRLAAIQDV